MSSRASADAPNPPTAGFRDPYVFHSPELVALLGNSTQGASGSLWSTISGGVHDAGPKLWLYRQTEDGDVTRWTYLGPLVEETAKSSWSAWSGSASPALAPSPARCQLTRRSPPSHQTSARTSRRLSSRASTPTARRRTTARTRRRSTSSATEPSKVRRPLAPPVVLRGGLTLAVPLALCRPSRPPEPLAALGRRRLYGRQRERRQHHQVCRCRRLVRLASSHPLRCPSPPLTLPSLASLSTQGIVVRVRRVPGRQPQRPRRLDVRGPSWVPRQRESPRLHPSR